MFQRLRLGLGAALGSMLQVLVRLLVMVVVMVVVAVVVEIIMVVVMRLLLLLLLLGVMVRMVVAVTCGSGEAPFHSPKARAGPRGLQRPLLPLSTGEAQPGQCDLPGPRPGWRETRRVGLRSLALLFLSRLPS